MKIWELTGPDPIADIGGVQWEAMYDNPDERGKRTTRNYAHPFFGDDAEMWSRELGIPGLMNDATLHGGGLQVMSPGGSLGIHLDYRYHPVVPAVVRAVSVVAFVNPEWRDEWGGALVFCRPDGTVFKRIVPKPNLMVAFECDEFSYHGVETVTGPKDRVTLAKSLLLPAGRSRALFIPNRSMR